MRDYEAFPQEPWNQDTYRTGPTKPKKSHGGLIALLLIAVIILVGVLSATSILNIRLFHELSNEKKQDTSLFSNTKEPDILPLSTGPSTDSTFPQTCQEDPSSVVVATSPASPENIPQEGGLSLQEIYSRCIHSVVSIACSYRSGSSSGTGVVLTQDGYIVTNCHVVDEADTIHVLFTDGRYLEAELIGADETSDLAVLRVEAEDLIPAQLGDSAALRVGDAVVAIGDPLGVELRGTMTDGIVSAINRDISVDGRTMSVIQTNAALNSGNSGGPLINCYGQVIGINTMKIGDYVNSAGVEGLGFAIPSVTVQEITNQLIEQGFVSGRPTLGLTGEALSTFYQFYYRLPEGLYITAVEEGSAAEAAGLQEGDILMTLGESRIRDGDSFKTAMYSLSPGDIVDAVIYRGGRQYTVTLTVGEISQ